MGSGAEVIIALTDLTMLLMGALYVTLIIAAGTFVPRPNGMEF